MKKGEKYVIEIDYVLELDEATGPLPVAKVKGLDGLFLTEEGLEKLQGLKEEEAKNSITVGDEVRFMDEEVLVVTRICPNGTFHGIDCEGRVHDLLEMDAYEPTGRHFDIEGILSQMKEQPKVEKEFRMCITDCTVKCRRNPLYVADENQVFADMSANCGDFFTL